MDIEAVGKVWQWSLVFSNKDNSEHNILFPFLTLGDGQVFVR